MTSILMVTKYYPPFSSGGTEEYIEIFSKKLTEKGLTVAVAGPSTVNSVTCEQKERVTIYRFPIHRIRKLEYSIEMRRFIKSFPIDIVHFHTFDVLCRFLRIGLKTPYVITTHGFQWTPSHNANPLVQLYKHQILKNNFKNAKRIFCVSQKDQQNIRNMLGNKPQNLRYLPNGVDFQKFSNLNKMALKKKNSLQGKTIITQVARFAPQKGQHVFLNAIKLLPKKTREACRFILAGYPFDKEYLFELRKSVKEHSLEKNILFLTDATDNQLIELYGTTDIFVLPSFVEGLPLTLFEAWAAKCAIIITDVGGIPYVVRNGTDGFVIPPDAPTILSQKIMQLIVNEDLRTGFSMKGVERARNEFNLNRIVDSLINEYRQI